MPFKKPILIVEDDTDTRFLYAEVLNSEGYRVLEAADCKTALQVLKENPEVGLILLDLTLPGMTAGEFLKQQRSSGRASEIPVITISGRADTKVQSADIGANDFLLKPFDIEHLIDKVKNWIFISGSHLTH